MRLNGLTVCVNYTYLLERTLPEWMKHLNSLTVVTSKSDEDTVRLITNLNDPRVNIYTTDAFYLDGADFNKGRAMEEALVDMPWISWQVLFDCDIIPSNNLSLVVRSLHDRTKLYGARRYEGPARPDAPLIPDDKVGYGYFQLFHSSDPKVQTRPLLSTNWRHAGGYDSDFLDKWGTAEALPFKLYHIGPSSNWYGVGNQQKMTEMRNRRAIERGISRSEKL